MKKVKLSEKQLSFEKTTIVGLNKQEMMRILGGKNNGNGGHKKLTGDESGGPQCDQNATSITI
jgi:hypothetical protein